MNIVQNMLCCITQEEILEIVLIYCSKKKKTMKKKHTECKQENTYSTFTVCVNMFILGQSC